MSKIHTLDIPLTEPLAAPQALRERLPLSIEGQSFIERKREEIRQILDGIDPRILLIIGPCSVHDITATKEYATKLQKLAESVSDNFLVLMRAYVEKPRTCLGWKGFVYDPDLDGSHDIASGISQSRKLLRDLCEMGIPTATELLDPTMCAYFSDLISWGCIGSRTSESQLHRQFASGLPFPIAFKNNTLGNVNIAIHGITVASEAQSYLSIDETGKAAIIRTCGNRHGHLVLRGSENQTNYDPASIQQAIEKLQLANLPPRVIIDCSHGNSEKRHEKQPAVFHSVIQQIIEGNRKIRGLVLESFLRAGNQQLTNDPSKLRYGISVTDACIDWTTTEQLVIWAHHKLQQNPPCERLTAQSEI